MGYRLLAGWWPGGSDLLPALRTCFAYSEREPDRATGWLYSAHQVGQLPRTPWPAALAGFGPVLLTELFKATGARFVAVCFQAYRDGSGCGWHHDRDWGAQAILSLGVSRSFGLRHGAAEQFLWLADGDVLYMPPGFQDEWEHCVPVEQVTGERCSLVFRGER